MKTAQQKRSQAIYQAKPEQVKDRVKRNAARREALRNGTVHKGDGKEIDHKTPLARGGSNAASNLQVLPAEQNRGWRKGKKGKALPT